EARSEAEGHCCAERVSRPDGVDDLGGNGVHMQCHRAVLDQIDALTPGGDDAAATAGELRKGTPFMPVYEDQIGPLQCGRGQMPRRSEIERNESRGGLDGRGDGLERDLELEEERVTAAERRHRAELRVGAGVDDDQVLT